MCAIWSTVASMATGVRHHRLCQSISAISHRVRRGVFTPPILEVQARLAPHHGSHHLLALVPVALVCAGSEKAAEYVGVYCAANALGRFFDTLMSGLLHPWIRALFVLARRSGRFRV